MVGSENHFLGVNGFVLMIAKGPGFVAVPNVVYGEEGLSLSSFLPGACVITSGIVPKVLGIATTWCSEVVVGFRTIAGEVTGLLQKLVVKADRGGNLKSAAHRLGAIGNRMHPGDPGRSGGGTDRTVVKAVQVAEAFLSELVDVRSFGVFASVTTDPFDAVVLAGYPENIGLGHYAVEAKG